MKPNFKLNKNNDNTIKSIIIDNKEYSINDLTKESKDLLTYQLPYSITGLNNKNYYKRIAKHMSYRDMAEGVMDLQLLGANIPKEIWCFLTVVDIYGENSNNIEYETKRMLDQLLSY
jgi:hypothetical protein